MTSNSISGEKTKQKSLVHSPHKIIHMLSPTDALETANENLVDSLLSTNHCYEISLKQIIALQSGEPFC